jgi:4-alpha-glucanotransferase
LIEEGLLRGSDCDDGRSFPKEAVDYEVVIRFKHKLFEKAWNTFSAMPRSALRLDYDKFCVGQAHWLDDYALFRALKARHGGVSYLEWPAALVGREPVALAEARRNLAELIGQVCFAQFLLFRQGKRLREHARARGLYRLTRATSGPIRNYVEDLGVITSDVRALRDQFQLPGTRILQFAFDGDAGNP